MKDAIDLHYGKLQNPVFLELQTVCQDVCVTSAFNSCVSPNVI